MEKRVGTVGFIISENRVLLAHIKYSEDKKLWNVIGGFAETNELPEEALIREFSEETAIRITKENIKKITELNGEIRLLVYRIDQWQGEIKAIDPSILELRWFDFDKVPFSQMHPGNDVWFPELLTNR